MESTFLFKSNLKEFIKKTRKCKRKTEERIVVAKELAKIRTEMKKEISSDKKKNLIEKMLYIYLLGFRTDFVQVECLKLAGCFEYHNKRVGYLSSRLLLDETEEFSSLSINLIKGDIQSKSAETVCLCLTFVSDSFFEELLTNVSTEIKQFLISKDLKIKKKASFCASKIATVSPSLCELFYEGSLEQIKDRSPAVVMGGVTLLLTLCSMNRIILEKHRLHLETHIARLRGLVYTQSTTNKINDINSPFLQIKILRLLKILGQGDAEISSKLSDILGLVAIKTCEKSKAGVSILYEAVTAILTIKTEYTLRTMAVNVIGRLLSTRDVLTKYIALNLFEKAVQNKKDRQTNSIQRHRQTIAECLKEEDPIIRKKAFGILILLIDDSSLSVLTEEAQQFLEKENKTIKDEYSPLLFNAMKKHQKELRWFVENTIRLISVCGDSLSDESIKDFISIASSDEQLSRYATYKLYQELNGNVNDVFIVVSLWFIGEFGDLIVDFGKMEEEEVNLLKFLVKITKNKEAGVILSLLTCVARLACRVPEYSDEVLSILKKYRKDADCSIQQKASEYILVLSNPEVCRSVFKKTKLRE